MNSLSISNYTCPVCLYDNLGEPPYNSDGYGSYEICTCCGFQFGYDDFPDKEASWILWREKWFSDGWKWFSEYNKPYVGWELERQIKKLQIMKLL